MRILIYLTAMVILQTQPELPELRPGETVEGVVTESDPEVTVFGPDNPYKEEMKHGKKYRARITTPGWYTLEMKSIFLNSYLVLRDAESNVLESDDDGLYGQHSRIVFEAEEADSEYIVEACCLFDEYGAFTLQLFAGVPPEMPPQEQEAAILREAEERVRAVEAQEDATVMEISRAINNLAKILMYRGDLERAKPLLERALKLREEAFGSEHLNTAYACEYLGNYHYLSGHYAEAEQLFAQAFEIKKRELSPDDILLATGYNNLALVTKAQGKYAEAKPFSERAVAIWEKALGPDHPKTILGINNLGSLLEKLGEYEEARRLLERALRVSEQKLGEEHAYTMGSMNNLASILYTLGNYEESQMLYERALGIMERSLNPKHPRIATCLDNCTLLLRAQGKYTEAKPLLERSLRIREEVLGPRHPSTALTLNHLAKLHFSLGDMEEAKTLFERALEIQEAVLGPDSTEVAITLNDLAGLLNKQGDHQEAQLLYERALAIQEKTLGPEHPDTSTCLNNYAQVLESQGKYSEALPIFERALAITEKVFGPEHPHVAISLNNLAWLLKTHGDLTEAVRLSERAFAIWEMNFGLDHPKTAMGLNNLGQMLFDQGRIGEAWNISRRALASRETHTRQLLWSLSEQERLHYLALSRETLVLFLSLSRSRGLPESEREAYETILKWKGWVARSLLQSRARLIRDLQPEAKERLAQLEQVKSQLSKALFTREIRDWSLHEQRVEHLRKEQADLESALIRLAGDSGDVDKVSVATLVKALPDGAAILDFFVHAWYEPAVIENGRAVRGAEKTEPHLSAWILTKRNPAPMHLDLGPVAPIQEAVEAFLESQLTLGSMVAARGASMTEVTDGAAADQANSAVRDLLWGPIAEPLGKADTIFVSPDAFLGTLPFEVIRLEDQTYLLEHCAFVYLQDMASLKGLAEEKAESTRSDLLVVGGVDYKEGGGQAWQRLPATLHESNAIAELHREAFENRGDRRLLLQGEAASEERLKRELPQYNLVHLATHGFFMSESLPSMWEQAKNDAGLMETRMQPGMERLTGMLPGYLSGLVFAGANSPPEDGRDDGFLTAEELTWLDLSGVDLVVLSACETGLGSPRGGQGMIGLRRSLRLAGAGTVISSLWAVMDEATRELMGNFYFRLWIQRQSKHQALRGAQLDLLEKNRAEHGHGLPSTWGAFVLDGNWK